MTRTPPAAPPITASVEEGLTAREVIPSRLNRPSSEVSLKIGVEERGSQNIRVLLPSAEMICLPVNRKLKRNGLMRINKTIPSGVNSPQLTGPVCPANTCIVFPEGTALK